MKGITRLALIALWPAMLFLPFKGALGAVIVFASVLAMGLLAEPARNSYRKLKQNVPALPKIPTAVNALVLSAVLLGLPFYTNVYVTDVAVLAGIYAILALGLNVVVGFTGLLNLGFVAFYAIGAYGYALLNTKLGMGFWTAMPLSIAISTIMGFVLSIPALRLKGDYLAIVTLGFGEITRLVLNNWDSLTNGPNGITGIEPPVIAGIELGGLRAYYYVTLTAVAISALVIRRVYRSKTGRAWVAIREDEIAASAMGVNTTLYRLYAMGFGAMWAGLAGVLFAAKMRFISPESFTFMESVFILCMVILGGMGSIAGAIAGAVILVVLPELLREFQLYRMLALGAGLVLLMIFRPQGLFGGRKRVSA